MAGHKGAIQKFIPTSPHIINPQTLQNVAVQMISLKLKFTKE